MHSLIAHGQLWTPAWVAALAGSTPTVHVRPSQLSTADGAEIDSIANEGSVGATFSQSTGTLRPLMRRDNAGPGKHAADFDGVNDLLTGPSITAVSPDGSWTAIAVIDLDGLAAGHPTEPWRDAEPFVDAGGYMGLTLRSNGGTPEVGAYRFRAGTQVVYATMSGAGVRQVVCASFSHLDGTLLAQAGLGTPVSNVGATTTTRSGAAQIGGFATNWLNGKVLEVIVWGSFLNTTQRNAVIAGAQAFYSA